jgi:hypothetical protein
MRLRGTRGGQLALVAVTIMSALVLGYITAVIIGGTRAAPAPDDLNIPDPLAVLETQIPAPTPTTSASAPAETDTPASEPTATATSGPTRTPTTPAAEVFIEDDFSTTESGRPLIDNGWPISDTATYSAGYVDDRYELRLNGQTYIGFSTRLPAQNYRLSVDVAVAEGGAGIVFLAAPQTTYRIILTPDGAYAIERAVRTSDGDSVTRIVEFTESPALQRTPGEANRLRIERRGDIVEFFANEENLTSFRIPPGDFENRYGFVITARSGQARASFDNLRGERLPATTD